MPAPATDHKKVQGTQSDIGDLTLRSGRTVKDVAIEVGGGITPTPMLTRTTEGASTVAVPIYDPDLSFLQHALLAEKFDAELDGLHFRYVGLSKTGKNLSLTLEDRDVAKIRELTGPKRAFREPNGAGSKGTTRAEFVKSLVNEANPSLDFFCPQLHVKQPIEKKAQGAKAKEEAKANRGKGVGASGGKVKGQKADAEQTEIVDRALRVAESLNAPLKARVALVAALIDESECRNTHGGTGSSVGVLQLLAEHGSLSERLDVEHCVHLFLTEGFTGAGGAIKLSNAHPTWSAAEVANQVQGPAAGASVYAPYQTEAREWVEGFEGGETSGSIEVTEPYEFKVGADETYWAAIQRLAKEVNWRAFVVAGRFFFIDEIELIRGEVRLAIDQDTEGIETVDFEYDTGMPVTEVTVTARVKKWGVPPGAVVTVAGYGPASFGSGDAPVKDKKAPHVASAVNAKTHEGKGRYLVASIECPLGGDKESRLATVTLKKPTAPLPEPANTTKTVGGTSSTPAGASIGGMGVLSGTPEDIVNQVIDYAHSNGFPSVTRQSVREANAVHGPTISGSISDHQGPPDVRWAADISNGTSTQQEADLAAAIAKAYNIPYHGTLTTGELAEATHSGYRMQLIHNTMTGGDHFNHVHFGVAVA